MEKNAKGDIIYAIKIYILGIFLVLVAFVMLQYMIGVKTGNIKT